MTTTAPAEDERAKRGELEKGLNEDEPWTLASDVKLMQFLKVLSERMQKRSRDIVKAMNDLGYRTGHTRTNLKNTINRFTLLSSSQFFENRVYEDRDDVPVTGEDVDTKGTEEKVGTSSSSLPSPANPFEVMRDSELGTTVRYRKGLRKTSSPRNKGRSSTSSKKKTFFEDDKGSDQETLTDIAGTDGSGTENGMRSATSTDDVTKLVEEARAVRKYDKMIRRTKLAFFMLFVFCLIVSLGHIWVVMVVWILQALAFRELTNIRYKNAKEQSLPWFRTFHWCLFVSATLFANGRALLMFCTNTPYVFKWGWDWRLERYEWALENWEYLTFMLYAVLFVSFVLSLKKGYYKYQIGQLTWTVFSLAITMVQANGLAENILEGYFWFIFPAMLIACNDTMAYFTGAFLGRRLIKRKFMRLSPKKTWEGFFGGMFFTIIFSALFSRIFAQYQWFVCPYNDRYCDVPEIFLDRIYDVPSVLVDVVRALPGGGDALPTQITIAPIQIHGLWLALFASLVAPFGGFFASGIKRAYKIKDYANIIPGHGGIMDRVDCQFIMACYTRVHYITWIRAASVVTVEGLLGQIGKLGEKEKLELFEILKSQLSATRLSVAATGA
eukprot:g1632.t1